MFKIGTGCSLHIPTTFYQKVSVITHTHKQLFGWRLLSFKTFFYGIKLPMLGECVFYKPSTVHTHSNDRKFLIESHNTFSQL